MKTLPKKYLKNFTKTINRGYTVYEKPKERSGFIGRVYLTNYEEIFYLSFGYTNDNVSFFGFFHEYTSGTGDANEKQIIIFY